MRTQLHSIIHSLIFFGFFAASLSALPTGQISRPERLAITISSHRYSHIQEPGMSTEEFVNGEHARHRRYIQAFDNEPRFVHNTMRYSQPPGPNDSPVNLEDAEEMDVDGGRGAQMSKKHRRSQVGQLSPLPVHPRNLRRRSGQITLKPENSWWGFGKEGLWWRRDVITGRTSPVESCLWTMRRIGRWSSREHACVWRMKTIFLNADWDVMIHFAKTWNRRRRPLVVDVVHIKYSNSRVLEATIDDHSITLNFHSHT